MGATAASAFDFSSYTDAYSNSDYREALNMGLKFFGGQRCGDTHNWMLEKNNDVSKKYCHTQDGKGSVNGGGNGNYDLSGGWHDCADHIKVGTTMGYAAASLLIAYDLWPKAFQDNYDDEYGAPNGIPDVMDEAKVATDYFMKSFIDDNTFVYYVGSSNDHRVWVTSSKQSDMGVNNGGDPRPVWTTTEKGGPQAANYASALALMSIHYPDATYKAKCKEYAIKAYNFAKKHTSNAGIPEFYGSPNDEWTDELALAAILLYRLTGEEAYKNEAVGYLQNKWESNSPLAWDTMSDYTYYYIIKADPTANNGAGGTFASHLEKNVYKTHITTAKGDPNGFPYYASRWGTNKLACGGAAAAALLVKLVDDGVITLSGNNIEEARNFNERIVDYVLGKNEFNHTFLHGFKGDMTYRLHHRNAMGRNDNPPTEVKNSCTYMFASGGMLGGPSGTGVFGNVVEGGASYTETEGGCDYNAPFVAAIARIVAEKDPVEGTSIIETSITENSFMVYPTCFEDYIAIDLIERNYDEGKVLAELISIEGKVLMKKEITNQISSYFETPSLAKGMYFVKISNNGKSVTYKAFKK